MAVIATLTMNPTIDVSYEVDRVFHTHKMRARAEAHAPGGGGINVARMLARLGDEAQCIYLAGGATGPALDGLVAALGLKTRRIAIAGDTRVATAVLERETGREYRFTPPGPAIGTGEWQACLDCLAELRCDFLVASGSLPRGAPDDFYARVASLMQARGGAMVLDSSGAALREGLAGGYVLLAKPSLGELRQLVGGNPQTVAEVSAAAAALVARGQARMIAVTMGHRGAVLATRADTVYLPSPHVEAASAVGAGDSFLAAMVHALAGGNPPHEALRHGIAAGAAAVLTAGTGLARTADIASLLEQVPPEPVRVAAAAG